MTVNMVQTRRYVKNYRIILIVFSLFVGLFMVSPLIAGDLVSDVGNVTSSTSSNPYGLAQMWANGDAVSRTVLLTLLLMSLGTWYIMVTKFLEQRHLLQSYKIVETEFWKYGNLEDGLTTLSTSSPFRDVAKTAMLSVEHHEAGMQETIDLYSWTTLALQRALHTVQSALQKGLAFLGTVGSTSPFIGLFGTVWGIYHALTAIGITGQASLDKVAGPVGESLIMTAIGLATAVPAVLGYNFLVRRNKMCMDKVRDFTADVQSVILGGVPASFAAQESLAEGEGDVTLHDSHTIER